MSSKKEPSKHIPDLDFFIFTNTHLPKFGFYITDLDAIVRTNKNQIMLLEKKCRLSEPSQCQKITYHFLHGLITGCNGKPIDIPSLGKIENWTYYGLHLLQFENTSFEDGKGFFDRQEVTKAELVKIFNFDSDRLKIYARGKNG